MVKTLTVKGVGNVSLKPDLIEISLHLRSLDMDYEKSASLEAAQLNNLQAALKSIGFKEEDIKTSYYNVSAEYSDYNEAGERKFSGYACTQGLNIRFKLDTDLLNLTLKTISASLSEPDLSVAFTVKDKNAADEALLKSASDNAKRKAAILADSMGVRLGNILSVKYSWDDVNICSPTSCNFGRKMEMPMCDGAFTPEDVILSDSATFVWEIK